MLFFACDFRLEEENMKTWKKPSTKATEAGFEVTRYMPAEIGTCKRK